jgi:hypothetical protein
MPQPATKWDSDKFRLRRLVERLADLGEVETHDEPVALSDLSPLMTANGRYPSVETRANCPSLESTMIEPLHPDLGAAPYERVAIRS